MPDSEPKPQWNWLIRGLRPTRWSLIGRLRSSKPPGGSTRIAEDEFCRAYWYPLYSFLRSAGYAQSNAQDHVQTFLIRVFDEEWLADADPEKGRLWNYLLTLLKRHVAAGKVRDGAKKRGGGAEFLTLDWASAEASFQGTNSGQNATSPEEAFRRALATRLVADGIAALRKRYEESGKLALLEELLPALDGVLQDGTYADVATRVGMSPNAVRAAAVRMRERFRLCVKESAASLLGIPDGPQLDAELHDLFCATVLPNSV